MMMIKKHDDDDDGDDGDLVGLLLLLLPHLRVDLLADDLRRELDIAELDGARPVRRRLHAPSLPLHLRLKLLIYKNRVFSPATGSGDARP